MGAKDHPQSSSGFMSRMRRTFLRNAPTTILQEMRPMLNRNAKAREEASRGKGRTTEEDAKSTLAIKDHGKDAFEFSVRDHSDATAKRGFRVQVPKRMICYTVLVFFVIPIVLFVYVEMHKHSLKKKAARYHTFDITKVLPHILDDILPDDEDNSTTLENGYASMEAVSKGSDSKDSSDDAAKAKTLAEAAAGKIDVDSEHALLDNNKNIQGNSSAVLKLTAANQTAAVSAEDHAEGTTDLKDTEIPGRLLRAYERKRLRRH